LELKNFDESKASDATLTWFVGVAARGIGNASGVQMPRHVGIMHRQDLLDAAAVTPGRQRQHQR